MVFRSIIETTVTRRISLGVVLVIIVVVIIIGVMMIGVIPLSQSSQSTPPNGAEPGRGRVELTP
jgi:flagellar basal body-associated protein FliL